MASGKCYHHPSTDAVAQCKVCNKGICKDCTEMYGVTSGEYAGQSLCYDCTTQLVAENVTEVETLRKKTKIELVIIGVGMVIGVIIGISFDSVGAAIFFGLLGGSGLMAVKTIGRFFSGCQELASGSPAGGLKAIIALCSILIAPFKTVWKIVTRVRQVNQSNAIITGDSQSLQEMRDYFAYTQEMEKQGAGIKLEKLADEGGVLFNNSYARAVLDKGEQAAQEGLRKSVIQISANGEILRGFNTMDKKPKKKEKKAA